MLATCWLHTLCSYSLDSHCESRVPTANEETVRCSCHGLLPKFNWRAISTEFHVWCIVGPNRGWKDEWEHGHRNLMPSLNSTLFMILPNLVSMKQSFVGCLRKGEYWMEPLLQGGDTGHLLRLSMGLPNCRDSAVEFCQNLTGRWETERPSFTCSHKQCPSKTLPLKVVYNWHSILYSLPKSECLSKCKHFMNTCISTSLGKRLPLKCIEINECSIMIHTAA